MKELIDEKTFVIMLTAAAVLIFVVGGVLFFGWRKKSKTASLVGIALLIGGPALWILWQIYAGIVKHFGLDSVKGLGVNIAVFVVVGLALGVFIGLLQQKIKK